MLWLNACHLVVVLSVLAFSGDGLRAALFLVNSPPCAVLVAYLAALAASSQLVVSRNLKEHTFNITLLLPFILFFTKLLYSR
jgi:hypothetical protein